MTPGAQTLNRTPSFETSAPNWSFHDLEDIRLTMGTSLYFNLKSKNYLVTAAVRKDWGN